MVTDTPLRAFTFFIRTGEIAGDIPVTNPKWGMVLNGPGPISCTIPARSRQVAGRDIKAATQLNRMGLAFSYGDTILEAGPILERSYDPATGHLQISGEGIWSILNARKILPAWAQAPRAENTQRAVVSFHGLTLGTIARYLVDLAMTAPPWGSGELPIVLPEPVAGDHRRTWYGYDLKWLGEALTELTGVIDGPDIRLRPRFDPADRTRIEFVLETGDPLLAHSGAPWVWDGNVPKGNVVDFGSTEDGRNVAGRAWRPGQGQELDMLLGQATNETLVRYEGMPWLETDTADKQESRLDVLDSRAAQDIENGAAPEESFTLQVRANSYPNLGEYRPGDWAFVTVPEGHPTIDSGKRLVRIMEVRGDDTNVVTLAVSGLVGSTEGSIHAVDHYVESDRRPPTPIIGDNTILGNSLIVSNGDPA